MHSKHIEILTLFLSLLFLFSCSPKRIISPLPTNQDETTQILLWKKRSLYNQYTEWKGTTYRNGGLSKAGIDCSGLVYLTYRIKFDYTLPRTTEEQAEFGKKVKSNDLETGDLLFFKTGWFRHHVGIYIEDGKFLHASTSQGVTISNLNNNYWQEAFYLAKRIDFQ